VDLVWRALRFHVDSTFGRWPLRVLVYVFLLVAVFSPSIDPMILAAMAACLLGLYWYGFYLRYADYPGGRPQAWEDLANGVKAEDWPVIRSS
jgi:hypothetical protein